VRLLFDEYLLPLIRRLLPRQQQEEAADNREALMLLDDGMSGLFEANRALLTNIYEHYCADIAGAVLKVTSSGIGGGGSGGSISPGFGSTGGSVARSGKGGSGRMRVKRLMSFEEALHVARDFGISPQHLNIQQARDARARAHARARASLARARAPARVATTNSQWLEEYRH
jgi:hypothetical protein